MQRKPQRRPVREMAHRQRRRHAAVLVQHDDIRHTARQSGARQRREHRRATVQAHAGGEEQADFLRERGEPAGWRARCRDENAGDGDSCQGRVFVVDVGKVGEVAGRGGLVVAVVALQLAVRPDGFVVDGLARGEGGSQRGSFRGRFGFALDERSSIEVVSSFAGLTALLLFRLDSNIEPTNDLLSW